MKKNTISLNRYFLLLMLIAGIVSCKKEVSKDVSNKPESNLKDFAQVLSNVSNVSSAQLKENQFLDQVIANASSFTTLTTYPIITYEPNQAALAKKVIIDWGDRNAGPDGVIRSGKAITEYTGNAGRDVGDKIIRSYENYKTESNDLIISYDGKSTSTVTQKGTANGSVLNVATVVENWARLVTLKSSSTLYPYVVNATSTVTTNLNTKDVVWSGTEDGNRQPAGQKKYFQWRSTFTNLTTKGSYAYIVSGTRSDKYVFVDPNLSSAEFPDVVTDYGSGTLDNKAVITYNSKTFNATLPLDTYQTFLIVSK